MREVLRMVNMSVKKGDYIMIMEILNMKEVFILVIIKVKGNIMMKTKMFYMRVILIMVNLEEKGNYIMKTELLNMKVIFGIINLMEKGSYIMKMVILNMKVIFIVVNMVAINIVIIQEKVYYIDRMEQLNTRENLNMENQMVALCFK